MRIEFGYGKAICLREEEFTEIALSGDKITYSRPNGQKITVLLSSAWISEPKAAMSQKPSRLDLNSGPNLQELSYGASSSSTAAAKGSTMCSETYLDSGRGSAEESNSRADELLVKEWDQRLGRLKDDLIQTRAEHHKELEAFRAQLLEIKNDPNALIDSKDFVNEVQTKLEAQIQSSNDNYIKEIELLKTRLAHLEEDSGSNQLKVNKLLEQSTDNESKRSKEKYEHSDWPSINVQAIHDYQKWEKEYRQAHNMPDFDDEDDYDDYASYDYDKQKTFYPDRRQKNLGKYGKG